MNVLEELVKESERCISCGFCESVCPTYRASGYRAAMGARGRVIIAREMVREKREKGSVSPGYANSFYSCLDCFACLQVCPAGVNAGRVSELARAVLVEGGGRENRKRVGDMVVRLTMRYRNPIGADFSDEGEGDGDTLLYTGRMYQTMGYSKVLVELRKRLGEKATERNAGIVARMPFLIRLLRQRPDEEVDREMQASVESIKFLLREAGVKFRFLGSSEPYPGTFLYDLGYYGEFRTYANSVCDEFRKMGIRRIIVTDPHTYDLLLNAYPKFVDRFDFEVTYYLDLLSALEFEQDEEVVFHEPCHFVLHMDYRGAHIALSKAARVKLPPRSGRNVFCCGGPDELLFPEMAEKVSEERYRELSEAGNGRIITACPICFSNLKKSERVVDISVFLKEKLKVRATVSGP
ncbi:hypothetical protein GCM10007108_03280 [Thermogymnomonas acidicola]|uniref:4Fe-4S ferredoxin-type domain-containing protein n=1 Tax=Thermogymnomonas acidicola TaxID=399579 RepID=A0AA37F903_9ARCH|nr:(Fe-S)-binding protein [Thermogymnomonas acidicola]GGM68494.1 hypothetical protein GCM10007108_03280 [Thermogymnomonas acidicola]